MKIIIEFFYYHSQVKPQTHSQFCVCGLTIFIIQYMKDNMFLNNEE